MTTLAYMIPSAIGPAYCCAECLKEADIDEGDEVIEITDPDDLLLHGLTRPEAIPCDGCGRDLPVQEVG